LFQTRNFAHEQIIFALYDTLQLVKARILYVTNN